MENNIAFEIDTRWITDTEVAIKWYDKVITEFPKTDAARLAHQRKIRTILSSQEYTYMRDGDDRRALFPDYIASVLTAFTAFEKDFPADISLQAFRYQIAQKQGAEIVFIKTSPKGGSKNWNFL